MDLVIAIKNIESMYALRYMSAVGFTANFWNHLTTLDVEFCYIWHNPKAKLPVKCLYIFHRYGSDLILGFSAYVLSGIGSSWLNEKNCQIWIWLFTLFGSTFALLYQFIVVFRLHKLWDHKKYITRLYTSGMIFCVCGLTAAAISDVLGFVRHPMFLSELQSCVISTKSKTTPVVLGIMTACDLIVIVFTFCNALNRPRRKNSEILFFLHQEGIRYFTVLFVLRLVNTVMAISLDVANESLLIPVTWAASTMISSRLYIMVSNYEFMN